MMLRNPPSRFMAHSRAGVAVCLGLWAAAAQAAETQRINPEKTLIRFEVPSGVWGITRGRFLQFDGRLAIDFDKPQRSRVDFRVEAASITTGSNGVDAYIKSDVLFDAVHFPAMSFISRHVEKLDDHHATVSGELTLRGETRPVDFLVNVERGKSRRGVVGFTAQGRIKRSDFGMDAGVPIVSDEVTITVTTEAEEPPAP